MVEYDNLVTFEWTRGLYYGIMVRKDRAGSPIGGGVAIICRNDWKAKALNVTDSLEFES